MDNIEFKIYRHDLYPAEDPKWTVVGFLIISFFYFIAERLSALPEIAANTKK